MSGAYACPILYYTPGLAPANHPFTIRPTLRTADVSGLERFAKLTGGLAFFPSEAKDVENAFVRTGPVFRHG
jgi:hypothetical protein